MSNSGLGLDSECGAQDLSMRQNVGSDAGRHPGDSRSDHYNDVCYCVTRFAVGITTEFAGFDDMQHNPDSSLTFHAMTLSVFANMGTDESHSVGMVE